MRTYLDYILNNIIGLLGLIASTVAAFVATKTYLLERRFRRNEFMVEAKHVNNGTNISIAITNIGAPCVIASVVAVIGAARPLKLKGRTDRLEYGTPVDISFLTTAINEIPVYVQGRIVITLTDKSQYLCELIPFGEMVNFKEQTISFVGITRPNIT